MIYQLEQFSLECRKYFVFGLVLLTTLSYKISRHSLANQSEKQNQSWLIRARAFSRAFCFEFWMVHWIVCVLCDWPDFALVLRHSIENFFMPCNVDAILPFLNLSTSSADASSRLPSLFALFVKASITSNRKTDRFCNMKWSALQFLAPLLFSSPHVMVWLHKTVPIFQGRKDNKNGTKY